ncbi:MAG TPA: epoxyqueuosine reductase QueH [bacterium]|nr:epoxyqueuosine reductase QueH [bacterium]
MIKPYSSPLTTSFANDVAQNSLLLHVCCAPCSTTALERLCTEFSVTAFFYNPNIHPAGERKKRIEEFTRLMTEMTIPYFVDDDDERHWFERTQGLEREPEGGARCLVCYKMRLEKTARIAKEAGMDFFATTLTLSPLKKAEVINETGQQLAQHYNLSYYDSNFKKQDGFRRSVELSGEHGLYRQDYCGCVYSQRN